MNSIKEGFKLREEEIQAQSKKERQTKPSISVAYEIRQVCLRYRVIAMFKNLQTQCSMTSLLTRLSDVLEQNIYPTRYSYDSTINCSETMKQSVDCLMFETIEQTPDSTTRCSGTREQLVNSTAICSEPREKLVDTDKRADS